MKCHRKNTSLRTIAAVAAEKQLPNASGTGGEAKSTRIIKNSVAFAVAIDNARFFLSFSSEFHTVFFASCWFFLLLFKLFSFPLWTKSCIVHRPAVSCLFLFELFILRTRTNYLANSRLHSQSVSASVHILCARFRSIVFVLRVPS